MKILKTVQLFWGSVVLIQKKKTWIIYSSSDNVIVINDLPESVIMVEEMSVSASA